MNSSTIAKPPRFRLVRPVVDVAPAPVLDPDQQAVVDHPGGPLLVLAGPGTGKTTTLVEAVVARIDAGVDPERILVLTFGRKAAAELRERVTARLSRTIREPLARTFHSYAFGLLRREAALRGEPVPRLLSGAEQDLVIRDLLRGDVEAAAGEPQDGAAPGGWPRALRAALLTRGFAQELRDLLLRCAERGVEPAELDRLGRLHGRPEWLAAARFAQQYGAVSALAEAAAYDPAELIGAVVDRMDDPRDELRNRERAAYDWIFVDEYQDTDPAQERLLAHLVPRGANLVVVGDPNQSIYAFRGADVRCIRRFPATFPTASGAPAPRLALLTCRRSAPAVVAAGRAVAAGLRARGGRSKEGDHAALRALAGRAPGRVDVLVAPSASSEAALVAGVLRRAHLVEGVPWSRMAVVVRSARGRLPVLRRAMVSAGVPVGVSGDELALADQPGLRPLLDVMTAALDRTRLDEERAVALLTGPLGGLDAVGMRRLRRHLRRAEFAAGGDRSSAALLVAALLDARELLLVPDPVRRPAQRLAALVARTRAAAVDGATAESVLWAAWDASGLSARWQAASLGGGARAAAADRDLDAVMALFEAAARFVDRLPGAAPALFLDHIAGQQIPGDSLAARAPGGDVVRVLTAHAAKGLEWDLVVVAGVQEGVWPDLRVRGSVLGSEVLVDVVSTGEPVRGSVLPRLLDEERRLFYVAVTRARERLVVTAVRNSDEGEQPSRLLADVPLAADDDAPIRAATSGGALISDDDTTLGALRRRLPLPDLLASVQAVRTDPDQPVATRRRAHELLGELAGLTRTMDLAALVAELRAAVTDGAADAGLRRAAACSLARLVAAGIPGADPKQWYGLLPLSDEGSLRAAGDVVGVSPSRVEQFTTCELRWLLESVGGTTGDTASQTVGNLVHDLAAATVDPALRSPAAVLGELDRRWQGIDLGSPWYTAAQRDRAEAMIRRFLAWLATDARELVDTELSFTVEVPAPVDGGTVTARVTGRVDRLERDAEGRGVVVDLKTGSSRPADDDLAVHPQLGVYQLAVERGGFIEHGVTVAGGASLVQVGQAAGKDAREQRQPALAATDDPAWAHRLVATVTAGMSGAQFTARENRYCTMCPVRSCCPLQAEGRAVAATAGTDR